MTVQNGLILLFALVVRIIALALSPDSLAEDPDAYARLARNLANAGVFGFESPDQSVTHSAFRPPLYPWLVSFCVADGQLSSLGVGSLHVAMGLATVWLVLSIGGRLGLPWAPLAGLAVACDPILVRASQFVMTETLATLLAALAWWLWLFVIPPKIGSKTSARRLPASRSNGQLGTGKHRTTEQSTPSQTSTHFWWRRLPAAVALGLVLGLGVLARPTAAPWAVLIALQLLWIGDGSWKRRVSTAIVVSVGVLVCVVPWAWRNFRELGKPIWATTHGGYTLLLANNPVIYQHFLRNGPTRDWDPSVFHAAWQDRGKHTAGEILREKYWIQSQEGNRIDVAAELVFLADAAPVQNDRIEESDKSTDPKSTEPLDLEIARGELDDDRLAYAAARANMERHPGFFAASCVTRIAWLWAPWPNAPASPSTLAIGIWYSLWFALALVGATTLSQRQERRFWLPAVLLIVCLTLVHAVYWSNMRMRAPAMPAVYLLACVGLELGQNVMQGGRRLFL